MGNDIRRFALRAGFFLVLSLSAWILPLRAEEPLPPELKNIGIDPTLGATIPLDLVFNDEEGKTVRLASFFGHGKPVILALVYYECPMLCNLALNSLTDGLKGIPWTAGDQFEIVTVSFNPKETSELAKAKKAAHIEELGRPQAAAGWHFLVGRDDQIKSLAAAVGYKYAWDPLQKQYAHATGMFFLTDSGKLARVLFGLDFSARSLRLALTETAEGKVGTLADKFLLFCYHYDPQSRGYSLAAFRIMQLGGILTMIFLFGVLGLFFGIERRQRRRAVAAAGVAPDLPVVGLDLATTEMDAKTGGDSDRTDQSVRDDVHE